LGVLLILLTYLLIIYGSTFLYVFGDDRVTCHTGADDITGDIADTQ